MGKQDWSKDRQAKQAEREMSNPDTSNVVDVPRTLKDLRALADYEFKDFDTVPGGKPAANPDEPTATEDGEEDPTLQKLISQMNLIGGKAERGEGHNEEPHESPEEEKGAMETTSISAQRELERARRRRERSAQVTVRQEYRKSAEEESQEVFQLREDLVNAESDNMEEVADNIRGDIAFLLENPETKTLVHKKDEEIRLEKEQAEKRASDEALHRAARDAITNMKDLYADLPDDPDAKPYLDGTPPKLNSPTKAIESTAKKGDSALLVVRVPAGTVVPTGKGGYETTLKDEAAQLRITVVKVEGTGDNSRVLREAEVTKETDGLHFRGVKTRPDAKPGVFHFIPPFFRRKEEGDRRNDPFDALKEGVFIPHNREFRARKQDEYFQSAAADASLTATQMLLEGAVGSARVEANWIVMAPGRDNERRGYPRYLRVVLARDEENGPVHVVAWGPPAQNKFSPRLNGIQPRATPDNRDALVVVPLTVEARVVENGRDGLNVYVRFSTVDKTLMNGEDDRAKNVNSALRDLNQCLRQALLNEHAVSAETEVNSPAAHEPKAEQGVEQLETGLTEEESLAKEPVRTKPRRNRSGPKGT